MLFFLYAEKEEIGSCQQSNNEHQAVRSPVKPQYPLRLYDADKQSSEDQYEHAANGHSGSSCDEIPLFDGTKYIALGDVQLFEH